MRINVYNSWRAVPDSEAIASQSAAVCGSSADSGSKSKFSGRIMFAPSRHHSVKILLRHVSEQRVTLRACSPCKKRDEAGLVRIQVSKHV